MKLQSIPIKDIVVTRQARQHFQPEAIEALARSLSQVGQIQPVVLKPQDQEYVLVAGERRIRALKELEEEEVMALILEDTVGEETCSLIQLAENIQREDLNPLEKAWAIKAYMELEKLNKKEASRRLGLPRTTLTEWLNILEVREVYQKKVVENFYGEDSPLTLSHISLARSLDSRVQDPTKKHDLLDQVLKHRLSRNETRRVVELCSREPFLTVEEATAVVLIAREQRRPLEEEAGGEKEITVQDLEKALDKMEKLLELLMGRSSEELQSHRDVLLPQIKYLYQLLGEVFPELKDSAIVLALKDKA